MDAPKSVRRPARVAAGKTEKVWRPWFYVAVASLAVAALVFVFVLAGVARDGGTPSTPPLVGGEGTPTPVARESATGTPGQPSTTITATGTPATEGRQLACGDILAPLNKLNFLAEDCAPNDLQDVPASMAQGRQQLRTEAMGAYLELVNAAANDGYTLYAISGYRSYQAQIAAYNSNLAGCGGKVACADRISAPPGHSGDQLGTTVDGLSPSAGLRLEAVGGTPEARWVADNPRRDGFVVR